MVLIEAQGPVGAVSDIAAEGQELRGVSSRAGVLRHRVSIESHEDEGRRAPHPECLG